MRLRNQILSTMGAAIAGMAFGGGVTAYGFGHADTDGTPVRAVRSPCDLAPPELVGRLLPQAVIGSDDHNLEPGEAGTAYASCGFRHIGEAASLDLTVRRSGPQIVYVGKKRETHPAGQVAREDFERSLTEQRAKCSVSPVQVGDQAVACQVEGESAPAYMVLARKADLVVTVSVEPAAPGREDLVRQLAAALLDAA
jgi:hypothetical protein